MQNGLGGGIHNGLKELVEAVGAALEVEPAEQGLQAGGRLVLGPGGRPGQIARREALPGTAGAQKMVRAISMMFSALPIG